MTILPYCILYTGIFFSVAIMSLNVSAQEISETSKAKKMNNLSNTQQYTEAVDNYLHYLTAKDLEGILSLYAENATVEDPVGGKIVRGIKEVRRFYTGAVKLDLVLTRTGPVRIAGVEAAFPFQLHMEIDGVKTVTDIIDVFRFDENGKIVSMRAYWGPDNRKIAEE